MRRAAFFDRNRRWCPGSDIRIVWRRKLCECQNQDTSQYTIPARFGFDIRYQDSPQHRDVESLAKAE
jgi:hypothetical protein